MKRWIDFYPTPEIKIIPVLSSTERMEFPESSHFCLKTEKCSIEIAQARRCREKKRNDNPPGMSNLRCWFSIYFSHPPEDPSQRTSLSVRNYMGRFVQNKTCTRICSIPAGDGNTWHEFLVSSNSSNTTSWKNTWLKRIYLLSISYHSLLLFFSFFFFVPGLL